MRNIILSLVLANLLMLAWGRWIAPGDVSDPLSFGGSAEAVLDPKLVLYAPAKAEPVAAAVEQPEPIKPIADVMQCERIGPFDNPEPALSIAQQLGRRGLTVEIGSETGDIWVGHWVQIADLGTPPAARQAVEQLVQAGLNDAYIVRTDPTVDISLGVFRGEAGAKRVERIAREAGMTPSRTDRFRTGTQHWVNVELRGTQALELTDLELRAAQILRTETVPCRPTADIVADGAEDSLESLAEAAAPE